MPTPPASPVDKLTTVHRIVVPGDARHMNHAPDGSIDVVFADPPYSISKERGLGWTFSKHVTTHEEWDRFSPEEYEEFTRAWLEQCRRVLRPGGTIFACGTYHNIYVLGYVMQRLGFRILNSIVWAKPNAQPNITARLFTESCEYLIWACISERGWTFNYWDMKEMNQGRQMRNYWKDIPSTPLRTGPSAGSRQGSEESPLEPWFDPAHHKPDNFWEVPYPSKKERWAGRHPTQKPLKLVERCLLAASNPGDTVLDPFLGSGTTTVAAMRLGRNSWGYEANPEYQPIIEKRIAAENQLLEDREKAQFISDASLLGNSSRTIKTGQG